MFRFNCICKCLFTLLFGTELGGNCTLKAGSYFAPMLIVAGLNSCEGVFNFTLCQLMLHLEQRQHRLQRCACHSKSRVHLIRGL